MSPSFFQNFWNIVGNDVIGVCLNFLNHDIFPSDINDMTIVLIPKVPNPEEVANFRPISLCNVIYKIISKAMANILNPILARVMSGNQSAFVPGRLIIDNIGVAFETLHFLKHQKSSHHGYAAIKLDMAKA